MGRAPSAQLISAPPAKAKNDKKKEVAAKAMERPNTICSRRRRPPPISPKARLSPVKMMVTTAITLATRSEEHTSELQSLRHLVCRLLLEKKKKNTIKTKIKKKTTKKSINTYHTTRHNNTQKCRRMQQNTIIPPLRNKHGHRTE